MIETAISQFGESIGIRSLSLSQEGKLRLSIEGAGELSVLYQVPKVIIGFSREVRYLERPEARRLLLATHFDRRHPWPVYPQRKGARSGFAVVLDEREIEFSTFVRAVDVLMGLVEEVHS